MKIRITTTVLSSLLVLALAGGAQAANLITNGGFETGDFAGWTAMPASSGSDFSVVAGFAHSGTDAAWFGAYYNQYDTIEQTLPTVAGETYNVDFWLQNLGIGPASFIAQWDGVTKYSTTFWPFFYTNVSFNVTAAGSDTLSFSGYEDLSFYILDDVSVSSVSSPTPEPGTLVMFGSGLLGLAGIARRKFNL